MNLTDDIRTARKTHHCLVCYSRIVRGSTYRLATFPWEGSIETWKEHVECGRVAQELLDLYGDPDGMGYNYELTFESLLDMWRNEGLTPEQRRETAGIVQQYADYAAVPKDEFPGDKTLALLNLSSALGGRVPSLLASHAEADRVMRLLADALGRLDLRHLTSDSERSKRAKDDALDALAEYDQLTGGDHAR